MQQQPITRREMFSRAGSGVALAALTIPSVRALAEELDSAAKRVAALPAADAARDEDFWAAPRLAIGEAILFHRGIGAQRKAERLRYLARYWENRLRDLPQVRFHTPFDDAQSCAIGTVEIEGIEPAALTQHLFNVHKIFTTPIVHDEFRGVRVTPSVYTTLAELDRFCEVMEGIARRGL